MNKRFHAICHYSRDAGGDRDQCRVCAGQGGGGQEVYRGAGRGQGRAGLLPRVPSRLEVQGLKEILYLRPIRFHN